MIKLITRLISVIIILFMVNPVNADETIKGHYCYTYGDKESLREAKDLTRTLAIRNAVESYRVYVESTTTVRNFTLTKDIIHTVSSGYLKNMKVIDHTEEERTICDTVEFTVSPNEIEKVIKREIKRRVQKNEEKGIDDNGYLKILRIDEHDFEKKSVLDGSISIRTSIEVKVRVLKKIYTNDEHCKVFIAYYNEDGEKTRTEVNGVSHETRDKRDPPFKELSKILGEKIDVFTDGWLYPGEIQTYLFQKEKDNTKYDVWLYDENKANDGLKSKTPVKKKKIYD